MEKSSSTSSSKTAPSMAQPGLPWPAISAVILFFLVQAVVVNSSAFWGAILPYCKPFDDDQVRAQAILRTLPADSSHKRVFVLGSSQARQGFDTPYFNRRFEDEGYVFYNLAVPGSAMPIDMYMQLDNLIAHKPTAVIYMPFVESFYQDYWEAQNNHLYYNFNPSVIPHLVKNLKYKEFRRLKDDLINSYLGMVSLFYKYRHQLVNIGANYIKAKVLHREPDFPEFPVTEKAGADHFIQEVDRSKGDRYHEVRMTRVNQALFIKSVERLRDNGIKLIVVTGPTHPMIHLTYESNLDRKYDTFLTEQSRRLDFVYISASQEPRFNGDEDFMDFTHLSTAGRAKFSQFFTPVLESALPASRFAAHTPASTAATTPVFPETIVK